MIDLVLDAGGEQALGVFLVHLAVEIGEAHPHLRRPLDFFVIFGDRQAAFLVDRHLLRRRQDFRIDETPRLRLGLAVLALLGEIHRDQPHRLRDLDRRKPDAGRVVHGLEHVVGELADLRRDLFDRPGDQPQLLVRQDDDFSECHDFSGYFGGRFKRLICRGQCAPAAVQGSLTMNFREALTTKINPRLTINVPYSFAFKAESDTRDSMNEILFTIGDLPVRTGAALIGFAALALILLLMIAIVMARAGRRGAELAMAQAIRADELEERLSEMMRAQSEATGRVDAMGQALAGRQAEMARAVSERLDSVTHRVGQSMEQTTRNTMDSLRVLHERLGIIDNAHKNLTDLTSQVTTLRDVLANKQSRGAFGQARMEAIVQDGMPKGSYEFQFTLSTGKRPDCVVFLPDQRPLCIDAKFPLEAMTALHDARTDEEKKFAIQRLRADVLKHVSDIAEKYLIAGETQDTALMFVPSESVYAEIHDGFDDVIQKAYRARVVLVSPSLLMLAIQVMQQILKDARMRDAADQIRTEVLNLGDDLSRLRDRVLKLQKHFSDANEDVRQILISADKIDKRAGRIEELDFSKSEPPAEVPRIVKSDTPELFPLPRKLQAGE